MKFLAIILCYGYAFAMDSPSPPFPWYSGLEIKCIYMPVSVLEPPYQNNILPITLSTDEAFTENLQQFGLSKEESIEIQNLPPLDYTRLPLNTDNQSPSGLSSWLFITESEASMVLNSANCDVMVTNEVINCVAVSIMSPQRALFAHLSKDNIMDDKTTHNLINLIPPEERATSKVCMVSSMYTLTFSKIYKTLRSFGFKNIAADIEPVVELGPHNPGDQYLKASHLTPFLPLYKYMDPIILENDAQKYFPIPGARVLIINIKTAKAYCLKNRNERHLESDIISNWLQKHHLYNNFFDLRFKL